MRLIGPKEFLKTVKAGTLYKRFWLSNEQECLDLIDKYKNNQDLYYWSETEIYGDNSGSLAFIKPDEYDYEHNKVEVHTIKGKKYDCLFYYDANVVGDASPTTTLYLVYDNENEWPDRIKIDSSEEYLSKEELINIKKWFLKSESFNDELKGWALETLETKDYYKDNKIVNYVGE